MVKLQHEFEKQQCAEQDNGRMHHLLIDGAIPTFGLQEKKGAKFDHEHNHNDFKQAGQHAGCCGGECHSTSSIDNKPGILSSLLSVLVDPVATFAYGLLLGGYVAIDAMVQAFNQVAK